MLENNNLHRRIQQKNLFRTFSRTYSRQSPFRNLHSHSNSHITQQTIHSTSTSFKLHQPNHTLTQPTSNHFELLTKRYEDQTMVSPFFKRTEAGNCNQTPFSNTLNLNHLDPVGSKMAKTSSNYFKTLIQTKKEGGSTVTDLAHPSRKQNFKLKSCSQTKSINYQAEIDQSDFSILQHHKLYEMRKQLEQKQQKQMEAQAKIGVLRYRLQQTANTSLRSTVGKRISGNPFNKFCRTSEGFNQVKRKQFTKETVEN